MVPFKKDHISQFDMLGAVVIRDEFFDDSSLRPQPVSAIPEWHMHQIVNEMLEDYRFLDKQNYKKVELAGIERDLEDEYMDLYNLKLVESVLTSVCLPPGKSVLETMDGPFGIIQELDDGSKIPYIKRKHFLFDPESAGETEQRNKSMIAIKQNRRCWNRVRDFLKKKSNFAQFFHKLVEFDIDDFSPEKKVRPMSCFNVKNLFFMQPLADLERDLEILVQGDDCVVI